MKIGWKKVTFKYNGCYYKAIAKLQILGRIVKPRIGVRLFIENEGNIYVSKYRTSKAKVLDIFPTKQTVSDLRRRRISVKDLSNVVYHGSYEYKYYKGKICVPQEKFDDSRDNDCSSGIHFFKRKFEAQAW